MPLILKNAPNVKFLEISNIFIASFDRPSFVEEEETVDNGVGTAKEKPKKSQRTIKETTEETAEETAIKKLRSAEKTILKMMSENPLITQKDMAEQMGLIEDGIFYQIKKLKAKGVLDRVGSTKTGRWVVLINL